VFLVFYKEKGSRDDTIKKQNIIKRLQTSCDAVKSSNVTNAVKFLFLK